VGGRELAARASSTSMLPRVTVARSGIRPATSASARLSARRSESRPTVASQPSCSGRTWTSSSVRDVRTASVAANRTAAADPPRLTATTTGATGLPISMVLPQPLRVVLWRTRVGDGAA
jgi:hypothetical protein